PTLRSPTLRSPTLFERSRGPQRSSPALDPLSTLLVFSRAAELRPSCGRAQPADAAPAAWRRP
ncbi:MAG: hypothetical protein KGJ55_12725, partial [Gammaproteobacteria bacterium]|nr:hypothetical protein [Gammaproteobacteria bacterium]